MAIAGIVSIIGIAGASDFGSITNSEIFVYGGISFLSAALGVWGHVNCSRCIESEKRRIKRKRAQRSVTVTTAKAA